MVKQLSRWDIEKYTPAPRTLRKGARYYDMLIMMGITLACNRFFSPVSWHFMLGSIILFYTLVYCPLLDSLNGGTFGKSSMGIELWDAHKQTKGISISVAYKRVLIASWPSVLAASLFVFKSYGHDLNIPVNQDDGESYATSAIDYICQFILLFQLIEMSVSHSFKLGQEWHDKMCGTIVVMRHNGNDFPAIDDLLDDYDKPKSIWKGINKYGVRL